MTSETRDGYEAPVVRDYGDLAALTAAAGVDGPEDCSGKHPGHDGTPASQ